MNRWATKVSLKILKTKIEPQRKRICKPYGINKWSRKLMESIKKRCLLHLSLGK